MTRPASTYFLQAGVLLAVLIGSTAGAATFIVTNLTDSDAGSLREAITLANSTPGDDTIKFSVSGTIILGITLPTIIDPAGLTIDGTGQSVTVSGNNAVRVMNVGAGATLNLVHLTVANGYSGYGGGLTNSGTVTVTNSTFSGNSSPGEAGGIYNNRGTVIVTNSTFSGNSAGSHYAGGGILNVYGTVTVTNSTFSGNSAYIGAGIFTAGTLNLANTILANSTSGGDCHYYSGTLNAYGMNLVEDGSCGASGDPAHFITGDPLLGELADNGGPTQTLALLPGSPAIDKADNTICAASPVNNVDQRGHVRPIDGDGDNQPVCDIGAFELGYPFTGFFQPVDNPPTYNTVKAGQGIPVKFSLGGDRGLDIFQPGYPTSTKITCATGALLDPIEETVATGASGLQYDPTTSTYTYVWKTDKTWAGFCRELNVKLLDGTSHTALFNFTK